MTAFTATDAQAASYISKEKRLIGVRYSAKTIDGEEYHAVFSFEDKAAIKMFHDKLGELIEALP